VSDTPARDAAEAPDTPADTGGTPPREAGPGTTDAGDGGAGTD
jgi:hypothetical protein